MNLVLNLDKLFVNLVQELLLELLHLTEFSELMLVVTALAPGKPLRHIVLLVILLVVQ